MRFTMLLIFCLPVFAQALTITVTTSDGQPAAGVAVVVEGLARLSESDALVEMDQRDEQFVPNLLVVPSGGAVRFPNNDIVMHHVYSFSEVKAFDLPLFKDEVPAPIELATPGLVEVGCNIHDRMVGHILVADSDYVGLTDKQGRVELTGLPPGARDVVVWAPWLGDYGSVRVPVASGQLDIRLPVNAPTKRRVIWEDDY